MKVRLDLLANLTYQLDCVSGLPISCSQENYRVLWEREFLHSQSDRERVDEWRRGRERYMEPLVLPFDGQEGVPPPLAGRTGLVRLFDKARGAGFQATSLRDYERLLELLTTPEDGARLVAVVRHFAPRFEAWWRREALPAGQPYRQRMETLLKESRIAARVAQFTRFYGSRQVTEAPLELVLLYRPKLTSEGTGGEQLERRSLVEFVAGEQPEERLDVVLHELCHYLYARMPLSSLQELETRFVRQMAGGRRPSVISAYNLLDEALATAFGNGLIGRAMLPAERFDALMAKPLSFYNEPSVDLAGKSLLPWLEGWLSAGHTLAHPEFVPRYVAELERAFGPALSTPKLYLNHLLLLSDETYGISFRHMVRAALQPAASFVVEEPCCGEKMRTEYQDKLNLGALVIVHPSRLDSLVDAGVLGALDVGVLRPRVDSRGAALFGFQRASGSYAFVIAARDAEGVECMVRHLAGAPALFTGLVGEEGFPQGTDCR
ncbi:hypothetical protein [Pyxidicoccus sp. MSG2]|uniref:hypothetical protein n=1 Tax=Pyxidicoccus sp. MSG2 TaxID=2996790 RepID=UPI0022716F79|nr:hypothetical protein [Pyxidicoccus sp. MSG2]MCY1021715.1 hypothetical protein [Pyxidicoccus sp. MSG2]